MPVKLNSTGGGSVTMDVGSTASNFTVTLPSGTGTAVVNNVSSAIVSGTAVSASGTSVDFTGIPSWAKRVTVMLNGVSLNGVGRHLIQLGTGGSPTTSGYLSNYMRISTDNSTVRSNNSITSGLPFFADEAGDVTTGVAVFTLLTGNTWLGFGGSITTGTNAGGDKVSCSITLSGTLNMIRVTTTTGTPTFDAGTINILYE